MMKNSDKVRGALFGVAVGDALGATVEFMDAGAIKAKYGSLREIMGGGWLNLVAGEVTDDTQMTIAVAEGIVESPNNPVPAVGKRFVKWMDSRPKDVGSTCAVAISFAKKFKTWDGIGEYANTYLHGKSAGNGSLMRTVYPGLWYSNDQQAMTAAMRISEMTHYDFKASTACAAYTGMIYGLVRGWDLVGTLTGFIDELPREYDLMCIMDGVDLKPSGYVVDSFKCALHAILTTDNFEDALIKAVNMGGDADTIGAITGGLAGAYYGYDAIPMRWKEKLMPDVREKLDDLADKAVDNV